LKSNIWLRYNQDSEIVEVIVRDAAGGKIETFKFRTRDIERHKHVARVLKEKYGVDFSGIPKDKDLDWLQD